MRFLILTLLFFVLSSYSIAQSSGFLGSKFKSEPSIKPSLGVGLDSVKSNSDNIIIGENLPFQVGQLDDLTMAEGKTVFSDLETTYHTNPRNRY